MTFDDWFQREYMKASTEVLFGCRRAWNAAQADSAERIKECNEFWSGKFDADYEQIQRLSMALENCRLLAARHRTESWALLILGFCAEGGVVGSITR